MKKLWRVTEPDAIAEFLKNEFYRDEFHRDRESFEHLVMHADLANEAENALRRALLFRRRGHMWRELPADTQWWEVCMEPGDLQLLRVFPRAQWRRIASGSFLLEDIVERIRNKKFSGRTREFISKVQALSYRLRTDQARSCVLLIGIDENSPFTILEGNHRLTAALLADGTLLHEPIPGAVRFFRPDARVVLVRNQSGQSVALCQESNAKPGVRQGCRHRARPERYP